MSLETKQFGLNIVTVLDFNPHSIDEGECDYTHITVVRGVEEPDDYDRICISSTKEARSIAAALNRVCDELDALGLEDDEQ